LGGIVGGTIRFLGLSFNFAGDMSNRSSKYLLNQIVVFIASYQQAGDHPKTVSNGRISPMMLSVLQPH